MIVNPDELFDGPDLVVHAEGAPPEEQPSNDNETSRSVATAMLAARQRLLLRCIAITSFAQLLLGSFSHFFTYLVVSVVLARELVTSVHVSCRLVRQVTPTSNVVGTRRSGDNAQRCTPNSYWLLLAKRPE